MDELTQDALKEYLHYCPDTGRLIWIKQPARQTKVSTLAGTTRKDGYVTVSFKNVRYLAHRLAFLYMLGRFPKEHVDHINGIPSDNTWSNLREVSRTANLRNTTKQARNLTGMVGVTWHKKLAKWRVNIGSKSRQVHLGVFTDLDEAIAARKLANKKHAYHPNHGKEKR